MSEAHTHTHTYRVTQLSTALSAGCTALQTFSSSFGVPYALPELNLVGIPDFAAGAMENFGLITYRSVPLNAHAHLDLRLVCGHKDLLCSAVTLICNAPRAFMFKYLRRFTQSEYGLRACMYMLVTYDIC